MDDKDLKIFVVDDDPAVLKSHVRILKKHFDVTSSLDAEDLVVMLKGGRKFDLVVSDVMMGNTTGLDLLLEARKTMAGEHLPFIFITGGCPSEIRRELLEQAEVLDKPCSIQQVLDSVRRNAGPK